jgi:hypothetical protein
MKCCRPVQELILPRKATLYYGDMAITFDTFQRFFEKTDIIQALICPTQFSKLALEEAWIGATRVSRIRTQFQAGRHPTFPELLWATQYHQVRDLSTKVYALIGLLSPDEQQSKLLMPIKAMTNEEIFTRAAMHILKRYQNLDILSYASCKIWEQRPNLSFSLPSWVPNFGTDKPSIEPLIQGVFGPYGSKDLCNAGGEDMFLLQMSMEFPSITVQGHRVDHVQLVKDIFTASESRDQLFQLYASLEQSNAGIKGLPNQSTLEVFWRTLHLDRQNGRRLRNDNEILATLHSDNVKSNSNLFKKDGTFDLKYSKGRRLLISTRGYLCLGPTEAKVDDLITVMPGGKVPYLLSQSGEYFKFVGEWYEKNQFETLEIELTLL